MGVIKPLDKAVVNKIAAGEILIAPSNAVKELLENAIDANATSISVTVREGGLKLLQISDNGGGIMKEDLDILCERFTTSKLKNVSDLESISTYGFRGEALASISQVSHLSVVTKTVDSDCAWKCQYSQGKLLQSPQPSAGKTGTQITVENLFYNFPSRLKSLKSPNEEFLRILDVVNKYAIHTEKVGFSLKKHGDVHNTIAVRELQSIDDRIRAVYGANVSKNLVSVSSNGCEVGESGLISFSGKVSNSNYTNKKKSVFVLFINNRLVDCEPLKKGLRSVFSVFLPKGTKPFVYLSLSIRPDNLDVNIHPTKREVRFLNEDAVVDTVCSSVQASLGEIDESRVFLSQRMSKRVNPSKPGSLEPPAKLQKASLSSFSYDSKPLDYNTVRVDGSQVKITMFMEQARGDEEKQKKVGDEDDQNEKASETENDGNEDIKRTTTQLQYVPKEKTEVALESIAHLRKEIEQNVNKDLTKVFSHCVIVGIVHYSQRFLALQSDSVLFLVDYGKLFYEVFYQLGLSHFSNFGSLKLTTPVSINDSLEIVKKSASLEVSQSRLQNSVQQFTQKNEMLAEYFNIVIDVSDEKQPLLCELPLYLTSYIPSMNKISLLLYKLVAAVDYADEKQCFHDVLKALAQFHVPESEPELDKLDRDSPQIMNYNRKIENLFYAKGNKFLATNDLISSVVEIANLPSLYRCFERC